MRKNENEIHIGLKKKLDTLNTVPGLTPEQFQNGKSKFLAEARSLARTVSLRPKARRTGWFEKLTSRKERYAMVKILTIILIAVSTALAGTGVVAAASQNSLPDQALYDVKLWTEDLRSGLASSVPEDSLNLALEFANRRISEISRLTNLGKASPDFVRQRLETQIYQAYQAVTQLQGDALTQALQRIEATLQTQEENMLRLRTNLQTEPECARTRDMLQQHLQLFKEQTGNSMELQGRIRLRLQLHKAEGSGNFQNGNQNTLQTEGTLQFGTGNGGNSYCLTGTPSGGYGNGNMYLLTGTPEGGYGYGNMYSLTGTPEGGYGNGYQYCLTGTPQPGSGSGQGGNP